MDGWSRRLFRMALPIGRVCGAAGGIVSQSSLERVLQSITEHVFNLTTQLLIGLSGLAGRSLAGALSQHDDRTRTHTTTTKLLSRNRSKRNSKFPKRVIRCRFLSSFFSPNRKFARRFGWAKGAWCAGHTSLMRGVTHGRTATREKTQHSTRKIKLEMRISTCTLRWS